MIKARAAGRARLFAAGLALCVASGVGGARADARPELPFVSFPGAPAPRYEHATARFHVGAEALLADFVPQALVRRAAGPPLWIGRRALSGEVMILSGGMTFALDPALARRLLVFHAFQTFGEIIVVAYDVEETFASGRSGGVTRDGMDIYRLVVDGETARFDKLVNKAPIGGIDSAIRDIAHPGGHLACGQSSCLMLGLRDGSVSVDSVPAAPKGWAGFVQVELFLRDGEPRVLLRRDDDDRFTPPPGPGSVVYRDCPILREEGCIDLPPGRLPMGVDARGEIVFAAACADIAALLDRDLSRLPNGGLTFWAMNNREGRVPWGQVYVLDGLADLVEGKALPGAAFDGLRAKAMARLRRELEPWMALASGEPPGFDSRRYSLDRADILSALHVSRATRVLSRWQVLESSAQNAAALRRMRRDIVDLVRPIEEIAGGEMRLKRGVRFWFDGSNAPWNFQSGWIEGLVALERAGLDVSGRRDAAAALIRGFVGAEIEPGRPNLWRYCAGPCQDGWTAADDVSTNTPVWEGNRTRTSTAHVSYRAMDVRAVLDALAAWRLDGLDWFPDYALGLVERGWLYPMIGAPLAQFGLRPRLHDGLVGRYGRAAIPFDIHNQVWALDQLARNLGCVGGR